MKLLLELNGVNENVVIETIAEYTEDAKLVDHTIISVCDLAWYDNNIFINVISLKNGLYNVIVKNVEVIK